MSDRSWGHCKNCKHFDSPAEVPLEDEEARCAHPVHSRYSLVVFGSCGCTGFELRTGVPAAAEHPGTLV